MTVALPVGDLEIGAQQPAESIHEDILLHHLRKLHRACLSSLHDQRNGSRAHSFRYHYCENPEKQKVSYFVRQGAFLFRQEGVRQVMPASKRRE